MNCGLMSSSTFFNTTAKIWHLIKVKIRKCLLEKLCSYLFNLSFHSEGHQFQSLQGLHN